MSENRVPPVALALGLGGLIPFIVCAAALALDVRLPVIDDPARALLGYGAVILSFLGGVRWGFALRMLDDGLRAQALVISVVPSIVAWLTLLAPVMMGLAVMPLLFLLLGLADRRLTDVGAPAWYARLRVLLTSIVVLTLLAALVAATF
jgi:hypothetical protein